MIRTDLLLDGGSDARDGVQQRGALQWQDLLVHALRHHGGRVCVCLFSESSRESVGRITSHSPQTNASNHHTHLCSRNRAVSPRATLGRRAPA